MKEEINFYSNNAEYGWLSNFARYPQIVDGKIYKTNEHYYQSQKTNDAEVSNWIASAPSPFLAMRAGRSLRIGKEFRRDWKKIKVEVMLNGLRAKFQQHPELAQKLLATGDAVLHENSPTDMFWGKKGKDSLGKLLMQVREELRLSRTFPANTASSHK
jgi:ribA/ribD-fused uncharacterized protein